MLGVWPRSNPFLAFKHKLKSKLAFRRFMECLKRRSVKSKPAQLFEGFVRCSNSTLHPCQTFKILRTSFGFFRIFCYVRKRDVDSNVYNARHTQKAPSHSGPGKMSANIYSDHKWMCETYCTHERHCCLGDLSAPRDTYLFDVVTRILLRKRRELQLAAYDNHDQTWSDHAVF